MVIEEAHDGFEITHASINHLDKRVQIEKRRYVRNFNQLGRFLIAPDRLIVGLSSHNATTIESTVNLKRFDPKAVLDEAELDSLIFRSLWEFLNHYRTWAAKKMGIPEMELVLSGVEVTDVRLGPHRVFNPLGFSGRDFLLRLRGTFVARKFINSIERLRRWAHDTIIVEGESVLTAAIAALNDLVVHATHESTRIFAARDYEQLFLKEYPWGFGHIVRAVAKNFSVDDEVARRIIDRYSHHYVSPRIRRLTEKILREEINSLFTMIAPISRGVRDNQPLTHFYFRFPIPSIVESWLNKPYARLAVFDERLKSQGFTLDVSKDVAGFSPKVHQSTLALLFQSVPRAQYEFLNQFLKRRARWLIAHS
ncbi:hypothetical protein HY967_03735 [Candidatus Jorgensenbacteria bacterium]|nr:hypothetical protein [Candidatus Jorgensenbacteria bacterium]